MHYFVFPFFRVNLKNKKQNPRVYWMPKKECLVVFNVLTLHILTYEGSWTGSWAGGVRIPLAGKKKTSCSPRYVIVNITV